MSTLRHRLQIDARKPRTVATGDRQVVYQFYRTPWLSSKRAGGSSAVQPNATPWLRLDGVRFRVQLPAAGFGSDSRFMRQSSSAAQAKGKPEK
jgi:hypothetical protein